MSAAAGYRGTPKAKGITSTTDSPSNIPIPRPKLETTPSTYSDAGASNLSAARSKQSKRDDAIRKKIDKELSKKKQNPARARAAKRTTPGTVMSLRPSPALQIKPSTTVAEAAQLMAAKREDCVLVTDDDDRIAGIFTAKDLAFRVVGEGVKASNVTIDQIMTKNPLCAKTDTSATDALDLMVRKGFRHLPVMDENHDISGILDITKCFYDAMEKLERAYSSSRKLYDALEGVQAELGSSQPQQIIQYVEAIRNKMSGPTLESVLTGLPPTTVSVRTSVKEAASLMKTHHTTAVLVQDQNAITGIFTSKDVVLRVIAAGLDPSTCSVVRVMTPHPDFAPQDMSIQAALRKMHDGHYLNLPVMGNDGDIVGMVDVLKLTYATLDQINTMSTGDGEGPAWNKFWMSLDHETESMMSGEGGSRMANTVDDGPASPGNNRPGFDRLDSVAPNDSASHNGLDSPEPFSAKSGLTSESVPFPFKFKAPSGRMHRLQVIPASGLSDLVTVVAEKLGTEAGQLGGVPSFEDGKLGFAGFALSYLDNEGDTVSITTDGDLIEAFTLACKSGRDKVDLFVHHPEQPPLPATVAPQAALPTPPASVRERKTGTGVEDESDDDSQVMERVTQRKSRKTDSVLGVASAPVAAEKEKEIIAGVPNELLLPGAIVTLAVVIIGVFAVTRSSSR